MKITALKISKKPKFDYILFLATILLVAFGVLMVYSASFYSAGLTYGNKFFFAKKQIIGAIIGLVALIALRFVNYNVFYKLRYIALIVSAALLALVFIPGLGVTNYGATRWINLGVTTLQPSEIAKFGYVIFAASMLAKNYEKIKTFKGILPCILGGCLICILIIIEPNMSITLCVGFTMLIMLLVGGARFKHFAIIGSVALVLAVVLVLTEPYRLKRLMAFIDPWASAQGEGFQLVQSLYAIGSGGWFGVGLFNSRQKYLFLPFSESDFIFSIIAEEWGFVGCLCLCLVFAIVIWRGIKIAKNAKDRFGCYLASGITAIIAVQLIINVAVVSGSIPPTGLPLPFISSGSTSLVVFMGAIGILQNIHWQSVKAKEDYIK